MSTERRENIIIDRDRLSTTLVTETVRTETEFFASLKEAKRKKLLEGISSFLIYDISFAITPVLIATGLVGILDFDGLVQRGLGFLLISASGVTFRNGIHFANKAEKAEKQLKAIRIRSRLGLED